MWCGEFILFSGSAKVPAVVEEDRFLIDQGEVLRFPQFLQNKGRVVFRFVQIFAHVILVQWGWWVLSVYIQACL